MTHSYEEHFPGEPLPMKDEVPFNGYYEYDTPDTDPERWEDEAERLDESEISLREGIENYQSTSQNDFGQQSAEVIDLTEARQRDYDKRLDGEADKLNGDYARARAMLALKGIYDPSTEPAL